MHYALQYDLIIKAFGCDKAVLVSGARRSGAHAQESGRFDASRLFIKGTGCCGELVLGPRGLPSLIGGERKMVIKSQRIKVEAPERKKTTRTPNVRFQRGRQHTLP